MIKTLIFDLGGVIVPLDFRRGYQEISRLTGIPAAEIPPRIGRTGLVPKFETGGIEAADFVEQLSGALGLNLPDSDFRQLWSCIFPTHTLLPESLFATLRRSYRLVLLSNTNALHFDTIVSSYPHLSHFDSYVLSYRVGCLKPEPRIYAEAIARSGCRAGECFFTDDVPAYVEGARAAGIDAEQFAGFDQLTAQLSARGIVWRDSEPDLQP